MYNRPEIKLILKSNRQHLQHHTNAKRLMELNPPCLPASTLLDGCNHIISNRYGVVQK